ncbi:hypothetical protein UWK_02262 [Desulfocapsa sulfexigens DSM 10523]|uniref:Uncharacterized protein n=1 Tax=Desulfocapsa sulfexigens (strain DSM 10523 / SB164P1) TaxID=1167006 RepID=M1PAX4_DESSD|nr:hypothetical protein [Desulfocapsa sulfexigens]AGF78802.1 hypothetical protein UWK_02262 [Desulfocapsa sulfexigens DSM 10523]
MGEKIKTLSKGKLINTVFEIELNHPNISGYEEVVHIQSDSFRLEIKKNDYIRYALAILLAEENLRNLKGIK